MKRVAALIVALLIAAGLVAAAVSATNSAESPTEEDFVPSEALPADSAISFPVDI